MIVGIDLGTTNSLIAVLNDGRPLVLTNGHGDSLTPSAVTIFDDGAISVGERAAQRIVTHPSQSVTAFKCMMGTPHRYSLGGREYSPQELSALVLMTLKQDAEAALGQPITEAVVTVPAYFGEAQRSATRDAGRIAGIKVDRLVNEPTAAALAYGLDHLNEEIRTVVIDLGGGTFDVTVLEILEGVIEIQSSAGDARLGGRDFTELLARDLLVRIKAPLDTETRDPMAWARIVSACETAKKRLSKDPEVGLAIPDLAVGTRDPSSVEELITRAHIDELSHGLLACIRRAILHALRDARMDPTSIDKVLMVGGATRMPCVTDLMTSIFGMIPSTELPPDEAVAQGAAIQAGLKSRDRAVAEVVVTDVAPFSLGVSVGSVIGNRVVSELFEPIIDRGTVLPTSRVESFSTIRDDQTKLLLEIYQGEHALCRDNENLGEYCIHGLPPKPAGQVSVDVRFTYDLNGLLEVDLMTSEGDEHHLFINHSATRLSEAEIAKARQAMQGLKFHPRDALPNVAALERADAVYQELIGNDRKELAAATTRFRLALEGQDRQEIERVREDLIRLFEFYKAPRTKGR